MAKAKKVPADFEVHLTLTKEEAVALQSVCSRIGGPAASRRRHFDSISSALYLIDIRDLGDLDVDVDSTNRAIYFTVAK